MAKHFRDLEVLELCGQGGMGIVYKARHTRLDRIVALKVLHQDASRDPAFAERFLREARALARLSHPGIVGVHDFGEVDGLFYLVMEFVDGVDLRRTIRGGELAPRQALSIVRELCDALQYAHDEGIVHRDIKPENVLIDRRGRVKIADFGLAKLAGAAMSGAGALTATGQVMGTPHYMAPEQIERPHDVDHRADIYSLGVVLYEMLTGSLPLGRFEAPSRRVDIDVRLDEIVLRTLEREPARRYQHAVDVKTDVDGMGQSAATATPDAPPEKRSEDRVFIAGIHGKHDPSSLLSSSIAFALAWVLAGWLFNFGDFALIVAGIALILVGLVVLKRRVERLGELAAALQSERPRRKWMRAIGAIVLAWVGFASIFAAHIATWERGVASYEPPPEALYLATNDQPDWYTLEQISYPGAKDPRDLADSHFVFLDDGRQLFTVPSFVFVAIAIVCWLAAVMCVTHLRSARGSFRPAAEVVISAFVGLVLVHIVIGVIGSGGPQLVHAIQDRQYTDTTNDAIYEKAHRWLLESGYQVQASLSGTLRDGEADSGQLIAFTAHVPDPLERWRTTWDGPARTRPHLYVRITSWSAGGGKHTELHVDSGWRAENSRAAEDWEQRVRGLLRRLNE
jgi:tRNA A-37 threonylcarbamoyl transferase component Bud32